MALISYGVIDEGRLEFDCCRPDPGGPDRLRSCRSRMGGGQPALDRRAHASRIDLEHHSRFPRPRRFPMSRGATYLGLLANLRQDEMLYEARQRRFSTEPIRPRRDRSFAASLLRALRITKR